jgi:hypothetical protein
MAAAHPPEHDQPHGQTVDIADEAQCRMMVDKKPGSHL